MQYEILPNIDFQQAYLSGVNLAYCLKFLSLCFLEEKTLDFICAS